ncbi:DUF1266 domain-containing protein [Cohnella terricola]|uniref:DUF1266 domain-containing protein n=1 Tax=Cohnella terricola TaxID=1289167 RepID=A0A559JAJ6_9BACL|nr:DUF1266 domain-containing protein [Cohnella terricola]TVX96883.1 DUF1266 domain-containing protein [Cohnella terricola]
MNIYKKQYILRKYMRAFAAICHAEIGREYLVTNPLAIRKRHLRSFFKGMGIHNEETFLTSFHSHLRGVLQNDYVKLCSSLERKTVAERVAYIQSITNEKHRLELLVVNEYFYRLPKGGVAAHDYTWAIFKSWAGCKLGYIDFERHWKYVEDILASVRRDYEDWESYLTGFFVGVALLNPDDPDFASIHRIQDTLSRLLKSRLSPLHGVSIRR